MKMLYPSKEQWQGIIQEGKFVIDECPNLHLLPCNISQNGERSVVFKMQDSCNGKYYALKCYISDTINRAINKGDEIDEKLLMIRKENYNSYVSYFEYNEQPSYLVDFRYVTITIDSIIYKGNVPAVLMDWIEGVTLGDCLKTLNVWIPNHLEKLNIIYLRFIQVVSDLFTKDFIHGNLSFDNIIVQEDNDIRLVDYDNLHMPFKGEQQRYFSVAGICKFFLTAEESDKYEIYFDLLFIIKAVVYLKCKLLNKDVSLFEEQVLNGIYCKKIGISDELLLLYGNIDVKVLMTLYYKIIYEQDVNSVLFVSAALGVNLEKIQLIDNYKALDRESDFLKNICLTQKFSFQELSIYKKILDWSEISKNKHIEWNDKTINALKDCIDWPIFVQEQDLCFLSEKRKCFLKLGCLWVDRYFKALDLWYFEHGKESIDAPYLKREMFCWFWNFITERFDEEGDYCYSINAIKPILCKYWINASMNYREWYLKRVNKEKFYLPVEFIVAFSIDDLIPIIPAPNDSFNLSKIKPSCLPLNNFSDDLFKPLDDIPSPLDDMCDDLVEYYDQKWKFIEVKGVVKYYGDGGGADGECYKAIESESVNKLIVSYLCLDEQVHVNYELVRFWMEQKTLDVFCWKNLSANRMFIKTEDIINIFSDYWDWSILCDSDNIPQDIWSIYFLENYEAQLDWDILSDKEQIGNLLWNKALINRFKNKWNWHILCNNRSEYLWTDELYQIFKEKWDEQDLCYPIKYNIIQCPNLELSISYKDNIKNFHENLSLILTHRDENTFWVDLNELYKKIKWDYSLLSVLENYFSQIKLFFYDENFYRFCKENNEIPWKLSWILRFKEKIEVHTLRSNPYLPLAPQLLKEMNEKCGNDYEFVHNILFLENIELLSKYWDEGKISSLKSVKMGNEINSDNCFFKNTTPIVDCSIRSGLEEYQSVAEVKENSVSPLFSIEYIRANKKSLDWNTLSLDESLVWSDDFIDEFRDNWNYSNLSRNKSIPWCENLIDKYIDNWNWKLLSLNNAVPWNKDLVLKYFSRLSVLYIKNRVLYDDECKECKIVHFLECPSMTINSEWEKVEFLEIIKNNLINYKRNIHFGEKSVNNIYEKIKLDKCFRRYSGLDDDF